MKNKKGMSGFGVLVLVLIIGFILYLYIKNIPSGAIVEGEYGYVVLKMTDAPVNVTSLTITFSRIRAHYSDTGWQTIHEENITKEIVSLKNVEELIGSNQLAVGNYTQIRLDIEKAVLNGDIELKIPSRTIKIVRPFQIYENATTEILLDFDAQNSVSGGETLNPVIRILRAEKL